MRLSLGSSMESSNYLATIRSLFSDKKFLGMCFSFGTVMGSFCIYGSLLDSILKPYQFDAD